MGFIVRFFATMTLVGQVSIGHSQDLPPLTNLRGDFQIHCKHSRKIILSDEEVKAARSTTSDKVIAFDRFVGFDESLYFAQSGSNSLSRSDRRETQNSYRTEVFRDPKALDASILILKNHSAFEFERRAKETYATHRRSQVSINVRKVSAFPAFTNLPPLPLSIGPEKMFDASDIRFEQFRKRMNVGAEWVACGIPFESRQKLLPLSPTPGFVADFVRQDVFSPRKAVFYNPNHPVREIIYDHWKQTELGFLPTKITVIDHELGDEENLDPFIDRKVVSKDVYEDIVYSLLKPRKELESVKDFLIDGMLVTDDFTNPGKAYSMKKSEWTYGDPYLDPDKSSAKIKE